MPMHSFCRIHILCWHFVFIVHHGWVRNRRAVEPATVERWLHLSAYQWNFCPGIPQPYTVIFFSTSFFFSAIFHYFRPFLYFVLTKNIVGDSCLVFISVRETVSSLFNEVELRLAEIMRCLSVLVRYVYCRCVMIMVEMQNFRDQIRVTIKGFFSFNKDTLKMKNHLRDFLVQIKVWNLIFFFISFEDSVELLRSPSIAYRFTIQSLTSKWWS